MKKFKKFTALMLVTAMVLGNSFAAFAALGADEIVDPAKGELSGDGKIEGIVDRSVFRVVLPVVDVKTTTFNFIMDPEGVIADTDGLGLGYATEEDYAAAFPAAASLYFKNEPTVSGSNATYSDQSDPLTVINKSSVPVKVSVKATVDAPEGVTLVTSDEFVDGENAAITTPSLYLALVDETAEEGIVAEIGASISDEIDSAATASKGTSDLYTVEFVSNKYEYVLDVDNAVENKDYTSTYQFNLKGATNTGGDWSGIEDLVAKIDVEWEVTEVPTDVAPSIATTIYTISDGSALVVNFSKGSGDLAAVTGVNKVTQFNNNTTSTLTTEYYTVDNEAGTLTFKSTLMTGVLGKGGRTFTIYFDDETKTSVGITVKTQ